VTGVRLRLALAAVALVVVGAACSGGDADAAGKLTVTGRAEVSSPGAKAQEEKGSRTVKFGDRVKVLEGTAVLRLEQGRQLEMRTGTDVVLEEGKADGKGRVTQPRLLESEILVEAPPGARLTVATEGTDVIVSSAARITRGPVLVVTSFSGDVELRAGDRSTTLAGLREVTVGADGQVSAPAPLSYDAEDPWDRRLLGDAIEVGNQLEARSKGFTAQLGPTEGRTVEFLAGLLPALSQQPSFGPGLFDPLRAPGESLVGAAIAVEGTRGTFEERWKAIFDFRDDGAQWGLVALDQEVTRGPLLTAVDAAIGRGPRSFVPLPLPEPEGSAAGGGPSSGGGGNSSGSSSGGTAGASGTTIAPPPTPPNPNIGPVDTGIPLIDNTINALVEALTGLLRSLGGSG
jgi:hypothetical protein